MPPGFRVEAFKVAGTLKLPVEGQLFADTGQSIDIVGWASDEGASVLPRAVFLRVDGCKDFEARVGPASAFQITVPPAALAPGQHDGYLVAKFDSGETVTSDRYRLAISGAKPIQIVVAGAPKTAGRHVASILRRYLEIAENPAFGYFPEGEHLLTHAFLEPALAKPFVLHAHPMARTSNVNNLRFYGLQSLVTWRNLGDIVISLDDHLCLQPEETWRHTYLFLENRESYMAMPVQKRYQFLIRNAVPWYIQFYLSWRTVRHPLFMRYEWMLEHEHDFFRYLLERLVGKIDEERLAKLVAAGPTTESGVNVGVRARSTNALSDESKRMLEELICLHPSDLEELLFELPWIGNARGSLELVLLEKTAEVYLVSDGLKRLASEHWLRTMSLDRSAARLVSAGTIATLRLGTNLY